MSPDGHLDLWAREHYKSTIITYGKTVQDILNDSGLTVGIFSHTRPIAKAFMKQVMLEFEQNKYLQSLFPDVLWEEPRRQAPSWSLDNGIIVNRKTNPKEATIEAWGLVDGQPISKHFGLLVYDDVVTRESVNTPEQIAKTNEAWELSLNLGAEGGRRRYIGTRYHFNDAYKTMMDRQAAHIRTYPATDDGTITGAPVLLSQESLDSKRREMGPYVFGSQMLQNPLADAAMGFHSDWLRFYDTRPEIRGWNLYLLIDPAGAKKRSSDYTVMKVIGAAPDANLYLIDAVRDRMSLTERANTLMRLHRKYGSAVKAVGYEQYGMQADIEHIKTVQERENYRFEITPLGGQMAKEDRIRRLVPKFAEHRFLLPRRLMYVDYEGKAHDYVAEFIHDEYEAFPVSLHDDMLDCASRICDEALGVRFPQPEALDRGLTVMTTANNEYDVLAS